MQIVVIRLWRPHMINQLMIISFIVYGKGAEEPIHYQIFFPSIFLWLNYIRCRLNNFII